MGFSNMLALDWSEWFTTFGAIGGEALNFIGHLFYAIFVGVGMLIEFVLSLFKKLAGIDAMHLTLENKYIDVGGEGRWTDISYAFITSDVVMTTFWTIFAMCIALLVVFTIFAIVKSEFSTDVKNAAKLPIIQRAVKSIVNFILIPVLSVASLYGANMLTKAVYYTFNGDSNYCITNVVFNAGATQANRASLDNGFANYLLSTQTVYFAADTKVSALEAMEAMLKKYFSVDGFIWVKSYRQSSENVTTSVSSNSGTWDGSPILAADDGDPYCIGELVKGIANGDYEATAGTRLGTFYCKPKGNKNVGEEWYEWIIQIPITVTYKNKNEGFCQTIPNAYINSANPSLYTLPDGGKAAKLNLYNGDKRTLYYHFESTSGTQYCHFSKSSLKNAIKAEDIDSWWKSSTNIQRCVYGFSDEDRTIIADTINIYANSIGAVSRQELEIAEVVELWDVLKAEYNTDDETVFKTMPSSSNETDILAITTKQRTALVDFINRIFVGNGDGKGAYCKYAVWKSGKSDFTLKTEDEMNDMVKSSNLGSTLTTIDQVETDEKYVSRFTTAAGITYLKISSETLHVETHTKTSWKNVYGDTEEWTTEYTPDVQQHWWKPTNFSGQAIMDIGLVGYFYKFNNMNLVMMLFGMVAIAWQYLKLILVFVKRALEMVLLFLMAPVVTAIAPLDKGSAEGSWRSNWIKQLTMTAVPVFAINIFFTIVPLISTLNFFGDSSVVNFGGMVNPLYATYNAFVSIIFIYVGVSMINKASALLAGFLGTEDMISTGKDLTGKALSTIGTASKGAAVVGGMALAGPAAAFKGLYSGLQGHKAKKKSLQKSKEAVLGDLDDQIAAAKESGDTARVASLQYKRDHFDEISKENRWVLKGHLEAANHDLEAANVDRESAQKKVDDTKNRMQGRDAFIAQQREKLEELEREREEKAAFFEKRGLSWNNSKEKRKLDKRQSDIESEIAHAEFEKKSYGKILERREKDLDNAQRRADNAQRRVDNAQGDVRLYDQVVNAPDDAKLAGKEARQEAWKAANDGGAVKALESGQKALNKTKGGKVISHIPGVNWAVNKAMFGALGILAQVGDRKFFSDTPKNGLDFIKGVDSSAGAILEKFMDPGSGGKVISTADENKFRDTVKEEKARKKAWEQQLKYEDEKIENQNKAQKETETKRILQEYERFKMGAFNVNGGKMTVNADRAETIAKNYDDIIKKRANEDYKNKVHEKDKDFEKFKKMLKDLEAEQKKDPQKVTVDSSDKTLSEQIMKAMKAVNYQSNKELKNINAGFDAMRKILSDILKKL